MDLCVFCGICVGWKELKPKFVNNLFTNSLRIFQRLFASIGHCVV